MLKVADHFKVVFLEFVVNPSAKLFSHFIYYLLISCTRCIPKKTFTTKGNDGLFCCRLSCAIVSLSTHLHSKILS